MEKIRLNKFISYNTKYSRREADELIKNGNVTINGRVIRDFIDVSGDEKIAINGKKIIKKKSFTMIVYNKPKGELVTKSDDRGRKTIYDTLPDGFSKFIPVGRLDFASEGVIILTDAPKIATALMNSDVLREYYLKIKGEINQNVINAMKDGFFANDATKGAHKQSKIKSMEFKPFVGYKIVKQSGGFTRIKVIINEGKNRELRRFFGYFDLEVMDLKRVSFGSVSLDNLKEGKWRYFTSSEYDKLRDFLKVNNIRY